MQNQWQWLAEVRVPADGNKYYLSTGVPLSRRYVLTTGHGVPQKDGVELRFVHDVIEGNMKWRPAEVVWHGGKDFDAALLEFDEVEDLISFIYTSSLPTSTTDWEGAGFPTVTKISKGELAGQRNTVGLNGRFLPGGALKTGELDLTVEAKPDLAKKWKGVSGAPVLCDGKLIGIIRSLEPDFDGDRLSAVPFWQLLENIDFFEKIGASDREDFLLASKNRAAKLLEDKENVLAALQAQKALSGISKAAVPIVEKLYSLEIEIFGATINHARKNRHIKAADIEILDQLLNLVLPHLLDHSVVESTGQNIRSGVLVQLPVTTRTVAEILLAGVDRRPTTFRRPISGQKNYPVGANLVEPPPEMGITADAGKNVTEFERMLKEKYLPEEDQSIALDDATLRDLINDELQYLAENAEFGQHRYYHICQNPDHTQMQKAFEILSSRYPQIIFIVLSGNAFVQERRWTRPLIDIFKAQPRRRR